jgi:hypothetical protein
LVYFSRWYTLRPFDIFHGYLVYLFPSWYLYCTKKNLATLVSTQRNCYDVTPGINFGPNFFS